MTIFKENNYDLEVLCTEDIDSRTVRFRKMAIYPAKQLKNTGFYEVWDEKAKVHGPWVKHDEIFHRVFIVIGPRKK